MNLMQFHFRYYKYDWNNNIYCHLWHCLGWAILDFCHQSLFLWNITISGSTLLQFCNIYCFVSEFWIFCFFLSINTNSYGNILMSLSLQNKTKKTFSTIGSAIHQVLWFQRYSFHSCTFSKNLDIQLMWLFTLF